MVENNSENLKMLYISYRIDERVNVVSMRREMKEEIKEIAKSNLTGMALEIIMDSLKDKDYDLSELSGYEDRETKYLEEYVKDEVYHGNFGSVAKMEDWEYQDGDDEWIWLTVNYFEKASYDAVLDELETWSEPSDFDDNYIDYEIDDGMMTISSDDDKDIMKLIKTLSGDPKTLEEFYRLDDLGIEIGAVTSIRPFTSNQVQNRICLRTFKDEKGYRRYAYISCVHTAIAVTNLEELHEDQEFYIRSSAGIKIELEFDQHFFALKSFVQAIAEFGLAKMIRESFNYSEMNFGFNNAMHSQFTKAIIELNIKLADELVDSFFFDVLNSNSFEIGKKWLLDRHSILSSRFKIHAFRIISQSEFKIYRNFRDLRIGYYKEKDLKSDSDLFQMNNSEHYGILNEFVGYPLYQVEKERDISILIEDEEI